MGGRLGGSGGGHWAKRGGRGGEQVTWQEVKGSTRWREVVIMRDSDSHYFAPGENNSFERYLKLGGSLIHKGRGPVYQRSN